MKMKVLLVVLTFVASPGFGQSKPQQYKLSVLKNQNRSATEFKDKFADYDFSKLWTKTENKFVYGYIGDNYRRLRIKFIAVIKESAGRYMIYGKSMVGTNRCNFKGVITISNIRKLKTTTYGIDDEYKSRNVIGQYLIIGDYILKEDINQPYAGVFSGVMTTGFYLTNDNKVHYDDIEFDADGYSNNEFVGTWTDRATGTIKTCNWADYRVPNSGDLDGGAGEFSPNNKYLKFGWQTVRDAYSNGEKAISAKKEEERVWWQ